MLAWSINIPHPSRYTHIRPAFGGCVICILINMGFYFETLPDGKVGGRLVDQCCFVITPIDRIEIYAADASFHRTHINIVPGVRQITPRKLLIKPPAQMGCRLLRVQRPREQTTCNQTRKAHAE